MASRIIHYALACRLARKMHVKDFDRFALGMLLPDAAMAGTGSAESHRKVRIRDDAYKTYDLPGFLREFPGRLPEEPLCVGYYLHLVQDLCFRDFVYRRHGWNPAVPGNVERLHRDYLLLNPRVIAHYDLTAELSFPESLSGEAPARGTEFDLRGLEQGFRGDFARKETGDFFFFTPEMTWEYVQEAEEVCLLEWEKLKKGQGAGEIAWEKAWKR